MAATLNPEAVSAGRWEDVHRIAEALDAARAVLRTVDTGSVKAERKGTSGPVTIADRAVNQKLYELLPRQDEGWLSEETRDDQRRLGCRRVWVVDPLDGTREFLAGIPEWCISIGLVEEGRAVAGGVANPATGEVILGSLETGVTANGKPVAVRPCRALEGALVLASRTEVGRGDWQRYGNPVFTLRPVGSVAYKLSLVAAGLADATWTLAPKHEWDVAAGVALVLAAGGVVLTAEGGVPRFNRPSPRLEGLRAFSEGAKDVFSSLPPEWWVGDPCRGS
jgi:myo-inositol-1(or 4)-monophosphatase